MPHVSRQVRVLLAAALAFAGASLAAQSSTPNRRPPIR